MTTKTYRFTTITDLTAAVRDLRPDAADLITAEDVLRARHSIGVRYEHIDDDALSTIIDMVIGEVESRGLSDSAPVDGPLWGTGMPKVGG